MLGCLLTISSSMLYAKVVSNRHFHFTINIPDQFQQLPDSLADNGSLYINMHSGLVFMFSGIEHKRFKSVFDYIDCSREDLEKELQAAYGDTALRLISCSQSAYYPRKTMVLHFRITPLPTGQDTYTIFFIHHRRKDIQISFTYKAELEKTDTGFLKEIMSTLALN